MEILQRNMRLSLAKAASDYLNRTCGAGYITIIRNGNRWNLVETDPVNRTCDPEIVKPLLEGFLAGYEAGANFAYQDILKGKS